MIIIYQENMLIKTKFNIPFSGYQIIKRKKLFEKLDRYKDYKLILITAPAGYGKTALISSWAEKANNNLNMIWLTLDGEDNQEELFWSYFLLSFYRNTWIPEEMKKRADSMFSNQIPFNKLHLIYFINDVAVMGRPIIMVLDDFGEIWNKRILEHMKFVIDYLPPNMHLLLSGRKYLKMELAKIKAAGSVLMLGREELQFSEEETFSFIRTVQANLPFDKYSEVYSIFEGWAAGMQMLALSLKDAMEISLPMLAKDPLIISYMAEEILSGLDESTIKFLMETSILDEFCPQLCEFLLNKEDSRLKIRELESWNLFVICLNKQQEWFRYHNLFREFLKNMLCKTEDDMLLPLYRKAALWHESKKRYLEAVAYAVKGEDFEKAVLLIEVLSKEIACKGEAGLLHKWNKLLPEEIVKNNPRLVLNSAWAYSAAGRMPEMLQCINHLQKLEPIPAEMRTELTALSSSNLVRPGAELERMLRECEQALQLLPLSTFLAQLISFNMGSIYLFQGSLEKSLYYFEQCYRNSANMKETYLTVISNKAIVISRIRHGKFEEAEQEIMKLLETIEDSGEDVLPVAGLLYAQIAEIYYQRNELEKALHMAAKGGRIGELGEDVWSAEENYLVLEKIYQAMGDQRGYQRIKKKAFICLKGRSFFDVGLKMESYHAQMLLLEGKLTLASHKISNLEKVIEPELIMVYPEFIFLKSRYYMIKGKFERSKEVLLPLKSAAKTSGQNGLLCEVLVLLSVINKKMENNIYAFKELEYAVALAEEQSRIRIFLDEKEIMEGMLKMLLEKKKAEGAKTIFVELLLDCFLPQSEKTISLPGDMLSTREIEILKQMKQGADNAEIAEKLFISPNTVKTHLLHIYNKLGVHSRLKAVSKAEVLSII